MIKNKFFNALTIVLILMQAVLPINALAMTSTDQPDYTPGSVVTIYGDNSDDAGFLPGESVHVDVLDASAAVILMCDAVANDFGAWSCQMTLAADSAAGDYSYTATGQTSGATQGGTFTVTAPPQPTPEPTQEPTAEPTAEPTQEPTLEPTVEPTQAPTLEPTATLPTSEPTLAPTATSVVYPSGPFITSDKDDYAPGELVTLTAGHWQPNESVHLIVNDTLGDSWRLSTDVLADNNGAFVYQFNLPDWFVAQYHVYAYGEVSGATTWDFTDARVVTTATLNNGASVTVAAGASITAVVTVQTDGSGANSRWRATGWRISTTPPGAFPSTITCVNHSNHDVAGTNSETFSITAPATAGTYNAYFVAFNDDSCSSGSGGNAPSGTFAMAGGVVVANSTTTTVSSSLNPSTYGDSVTFTATVSSSSAPTGSVNFIIDGGSPVAGTVGSTTSTTAKWTLATSSLSAGNHTVQAVYVHTGSFLDSNGTLSGGQNVSVKAATVSADAKSKTYGDDNPTLTATVTGTVNGDSLDYSLSTTAVKFSSVGNYPITVTLGTNPNYNVTKMDGTLSIGQKAATVSADAKGKAYGDDNPTLTATVTGTVNGDTLNFSLATTAVKFSGVGNYPITVTLGSNSNYSVTKTDGTLSIGQKDATITANDKSKTYGNANPALDATVTGTVNGDTLDYSLATGATQFSNVGDYAIVVTLGSNPNYNVTAVDGNLSIGQKDATVTANDKNKTYGDVNPVLDATVVGEVSGGDAINYTLDTSPTQFSNVGDYAIVVTLGTNPNYNVTAVDGNLSIGQKDATVTANDKSKTYGDVNPALDATVTGTVNGDTLDYTLATSATQFSNVGDYAIVVTLGTNPNYNATAVDGNLSIGQKDATVTANDKNKTYGDANPALDATVTGTVNGDTLDYSLATSATQFSNVGDYAIVVTLGSNPNYNVTAVDGTLSIGQKDATVTANDKNKTYGDVNPALDATVEGEVAGGDAINYSLATSATQFSNVGDYAIVVTLGSNPNYNVTPVDGTLSIGQKDATVTANDKNKTYGDANPALDATVTGTVNGDALDYSLATSATQFSNVGDYAIVVTLGSNPNYNVTAVDGTLSIGQKDATVTANDKSKTYGDVNPALDATVTGTVNGDTLDYTLATSPTQFSNVGDYAIVVTLGSNPNYNVTPVDGTLSITARLASVTANDKNKTYGDVNPALDATVTGTVNGDTLDYTLATSATQFSNVGDYAIVVTLGSNPNYNVTAVDGTLSIGQKDATVTANDKNKTYGDVNPALDAMVTGTVNGDVLDYSLTTSAMQFSNVGDYAIVVTLGSNPNYNVTTEDGNLSISVKDATVTANDKSKTYGDVNPVLDATVVGEVSGGDAINYTLGTTATQFSNVGDYAIVVTLGTNPNYNVAAVDGNLHINQKAASVTPNAANKVYGSADPLLSGTLNGFLAADGVTATYSRTPGETVAGSPYTINATLSPASVLSNYAITYNTANFTITKKAASVTPNPASKIFGSPDPVFTGTLSGFLPADSVTATYGRTAGEAVGTYTISATLSPAGVLGNYNITYNTATFTISPWTKQGFYQPVDMGSVWNTVKSGSTVPLKFELFSGTSELTDVSAVLSIKSKVVACTAMPGAVEDAIETLASTGGTALRYDSTSGQFIFNWKTSGGAGTCLQVTMTAADNTTTITAFFKLK